MILFLKFFLYGKIVSSPVSTMLKRPILRVQARLHLAVLELVLPLAPCAWPPGLPLAPGARLQRAEDPLAQ